jgi:hypothetical protein
MQDTRIHGREIHSLAIRSRSLPWRFHWRLASSTLSVQALHDFVRHALNTFTD